MSMAEDVKQEVLAILKPIMKPLAKLIFAKFFKLIEEKVLATATPIDDIVVASLKQAAEKYIEDHV